MNTETSHISHSKTSVAALSLAAIGVVFGDIGTSPLYALKETLSPHHHVLPTVDNIIGIVSLIIWTLTFIVSFKYVALILRADNNGEGGNMAMLALALNSLGRQNKLYSTVVIIGLIGAALFYGDGVITPAISVLSAVEGLEVATPAFKNYVIPIVLVIIIALYSIQKQGTASIGKFFGPIMVVWFLVLGALGIYNLMLYDLTIINALNPWYAFAFAKDNGFIAFVALGSVTLAITGGEALYADMGHFGRNPIRLGWYILVFPMLSLCYLGQGALVLAHLNNQNDLAIILKNPFFFMSPQWGVVPLVILATTATVVASQATISGCFSLTKQAIQLGFLPRMTILHTSTKEAGQIYIPFINWSQCVLVLAVVIGFGSSSSLAAAYGIAVTGCMAVVTIMTFFVTRYQWKIPLHMCLISAFVFLSIDALFLASNLVKFPDGGWFPVVLALGIFIIMYTWYRGRVAIRNTTEEQNIFLKGYLESIFIQPPPEVEGTAIYLNAKSGIVPRALMHNLLHNKVIHERNVFLTVKTLDIPWVPFDQRVKVESLGHNCFAVEINYGFKNQPNIPESLELCKPYGLTFEEMETSYFLSRYTLLSDTSNSLPLWMERLFAIMVRNASNPAEYLALPIERVIELGAQIRI